MIRGRIRLFLTEGELMGLTLTLHRPAAVTEKKAYVFSVYTTRQMQKRLSSTFARRTPLRVNTTKSGQYMEGFRGYEERDSRRSTSSRRPEGRGQWCDLRHAQQPTVADDPISTRLSNRLRHKAHIFVDRRSTSTTYFRVSPELPKGSSSFTRLA